MNYTILDNIIAKLRFNFVYKNIPEIKGRILDLGCGLRPWFLNLKNQEVEIYALDRFEKLDLPVKVKYISFELSKTLPFKDNFFDLVTMLAVLEHLEYEREILMEIKRILKPGGCLLITVPTFRAKPILELLAGLKIINADSIKEHKRYYNKEILNKTLSDIGFSILESKYFELGFNLYVLAKKL